MAHRYAEVVDSDCVAGEPEEGVAPCRSASAATGATVAADAVQRILTAPRLGHGTPAGPQRKSGHALASPSAVEYRFGLRRRIGLNQWISAGELGEFTGSSPQLEGEYSLALGSAPLGRLRCDRRAGRFWSNVDDVSGVPHPGMRDIPPVATDAPPLDPCLEPRDSANLEWSERQTHHSEVTEMSNTIKRTVTAFAIAAFALGAGAGIASADTTGGGGWFDPGIGGPGISLTGNGNGGDVSNGNGGNLTDNGYQLCVAGVTVFCPH
ncbi:hypothetical protein FK531_09215 [Rhodococcus spelaei]|uniref:Uncharacterized protein n=1 Tax=Rhodococcus spelaei TaxID=2546320 RepID=A0A541BMU6_9NOCA|nr:hypothetical protein [Rhodococcus spelaei]TQF73639.1 hypothetical protein FK531_09215 [Rhodococcus spelaei]